MKKLTRQSLLIAVSAIICSQAVAHEAQPYTGWCTQKPYCTFNFKGKTYPYPVGWRISDTPYLDDEDVNVATYEGERRVDGMGVSVNMPHQATMPDCMNNSASNICFLEAEGGNRFYPISQYERSTWLGQPTADNGTISRQWQLLNAPVNVILKINGVNASEALFNADAADREIERAQSSQMANAHQGSGEIHGGQVQFTTRIADTYRISVGNDIIWGGEEPLFTNTIIVKPSPSKQCFTLSPNQAADYPLQPVPCTP